MTYRVHIGGFEPAVIGIKPDFFYFGAQGKHWRTYAVKQIFCIVFGNGKSLNGALFAYPAHKRFFIGGIYTDKAALFAYQVDKFFCVLRLLVIIVFRIVKDYHTVGREHIGIFQAKSRDVAVQGQVFDNNDLSFRKHRKRTCCGFKLFWGKRFAVIAVCHVVTDVLGQECVTQFFKPKEFQIRFVAENIVHGRKLAAFQLFGYKFRSDRIFRSHEIHPFSFSYLLFNISLLYNYEAMLSISKNRKSSQKGLDSRLIIWYNQ